MNERKLKIFYEVATRLNMTEAGKTLFMSQPAISQVIKELELEHNITFFDRIGKKLFLTNEGEVFLGYARRILNLADECNQAIKDLSELKTGKLKIGASTTIGIYILADIVGKYTKQNKDLDISIIIENTKNIADMILKNKIDFAFVEGPVHSEEIIVKEFCDDELVIITPYGHYVSSKEAVSIEDLKNEKIIMREKGSGTREVFESLLKLHNFELENYLELGNTEAIKKAVEAGLGISCISARAVKNEIEYKKLSQIKVKEAIISRKLNLIFHKDKYLSGLFEDFIQFCKQSI